MRLSLFPLAFRVENAVIGEDPKFRTGRPFAQVQTFFVRPELLPLLHRQIEISSVQLNRPAVELVRNEQGVWNFSSLMGQKGKTQTQPRAFSLDQLKIYDGQIGLTDLQQRKPRAVYDHIDVMASNFAPDQASSVDVRAHMPGAGKQAIALRGKVGPFQRDGVARTPFDGRFELNGASLSSLQRFLNVEALANSDAVITGTAELKNTADALASKGKFDIQNARVRGVDIGYPIAIDYQAMGNLNESKADIQQANLRLGQTPILLRGTVNAQSTPAQVDMTAKASNVSMAETARLASALGVAFNSANTINGNLNLDIHAQGQINKPALNGNVEAKNLNVSGGDLREPVQVDVLQLALSPDKIQSNEFTARTGHTSAAAQFMLTGYTSDAPRIDAKLNTGNADLQELLRIAHAYGISAVEGTNGSGLVTINLTVSGPVKETQQLAFSGTGAIRNASLETPALAKPLSVRKADLQFNGDSVNLTNFEATIGQTTARGNLTASNFSAPRLQFALAANDINVAEWEQLFKIGSNKAGDGQSRPSARAGATAQMVPAQQGNLISRMTGTGTLTADTVVYDDLTLKNVQSTVTLDHGLITVKPLTASLYNGQQVGSAVIDTRTTPPTYVVDSKLQNVDANQLLSSVSPLKQTLYGLLSANADAHFTTAAGAQSILPSLTGKVSLNLRDGKIANVDLLHELATIAQFQRTASAVEPFTQVVQLTGDFDISNGVARTNNLNAVIVAGTVAAQGVVDLAHQRLNLRLTAALSQAFSQSVGGTNIGGFLNTALANNQGELVIPVLVTGTFRQPTFAPDLESVAQMKLQNLVPSVNDPSGLTNGILGQIFRGKPTAPAGQNPAQQQNSQQQNRQQQNQPSNPLNNLFDLFGNKKK